MKIGAVVTKADLETIKSNRGYVNDTFCVIPIEGKMTLTESEDGTLMIDGEGYCCQTREDAKRILRDYVDSHPKDGFKWVKEHYFHTMKATGEVSSADADLAKEYGFTVYKKRKYEDGWVVLVNEASTNTSRRYRSGKLVNGQLFLVGTEDGHSARVPEEAVGYCYCSRGWGHRPNSEYALTLAAPVEDASILTESHRG
jgi:hypothetical protein